MQYGLAVSDNHYFDKNPHIPSQRQRVEVELGGKLLDVVTDAGVFSSSGVDKGTQILLKHSELASKQGRILDLGAGWGPITLELALRNPETVVYPVEVNSRALELIETNSKSLGLKNVEPVDLDSIAESSIDQIWSNPPIRIGKRALHDLLRSAFSKLKPAGEAFLVVQKHLGSDSLARWIEQELGYSVEKIDNSKGFRVFRVARS